ncbi:MAG: hypothetical protein RL609_1591 [Bacteroidota bacterium]|jgi:drug/metabolite transporter (DMT)-like permease
MTRNSAVGLLYLIVFIWGFTGILGKEISLSPIPLVFWRTLIAWVGISVYLLYKRYSIVFSSGQWRGMILSGLIIALHWICFFTAIKVSNVSTALTVLSTNAIFVSVVAPWIMQTRWNWREGVVGAVAVLGLVFIFNFETRYWEGICWSLFAALFAATFSSINARLVKNIDPTPMAWVEIGVACICVLIYIIFSADVSFEAQNLNFKNTGLLLILGWVATSFPFIASIGIMRQISPFVCAMAINLEPLYTIVIALFLYGESEYMSSGFYIGGLLILLTTFLGPIWSKSK